MADDTTQRAAFNFLRTHLQTQELFTIEEFRDATGWEKPGTLKTYLVKQYKGIFEKVGDKYRVSETFRKFVTWRKFKQHVTQVRRVVTNYDPTSSEVMMYDFLMPLTNEAYLRTTLDALFFKDTIAARLKTIGAAELKRNLRQYANEEDARLYEAVLKFIEAHFAGYSIYHVDGRFRSGKLRTQDEVADLQKKGERYLIDETTAVARFIFPYADAEELNSVRYLFRILFVRSIIQLVNGEEQIWMLETGPENKVHIWAALGEDDAEQHEDDTEDSEADL
jgi:hypothetical protein